MEIQERIGLNVRRARLAAAVSQSDLVAKLDAVVDDHSIDQGYISRLETGQHNPTVQTLSRIAQALEVTMAQLVNESAQRDIGVVNSPETNSSSRRNTPPGADSQTQWPNVFRTAHMPGGLRAVEIAPATVKFGPVPGGEKTLTVTSFPDLGNEVQRSTGLQPLGVEYFRTEDEIDATAQSNWRPVLPRDKDVWPTHVAELNWSGLSNSARLRGDARLYLIAGSITSQHRFAAMRLLDLSNLYMRNIVSVIASGIDMAEHVVMHGFHADMLFSSIHAAFFEIATLRDYLAEYIAFAIYGDKKVDAFHKLPDLVRKRAIGTELESEIDLMYNQNNGWLFQFSERRNTLAHRMPFDRLAGGGAMHFKRHEMPIGGAAWLLHVPVPEPVAIRHKDAFSLPVDVEHQADEFMDATRRAAVRADTLDYLFEIFGRLVDFGNRLSSTFPYPPEMVTITDADIISAQFGDQSTGQSAESSGG